MKLDELAKLLSKIDPARLQSLFPSREDQRRFETARGIVVGIVESLHSGALDPACFDQVETAASEFRSLYSKLSRKTQIASRSVLNEAVLWAEVGHLERSIYLSGVAREKKVQEPYRSQLNSLPTHACCSRYRQITQLSEAVRGKVSEAAYAKIHPLFDEMRRSYLTQFVYFAGQAYLENRDHPMVAYMQTLACLMNAYELELAGRTAESAALTATGYEAIRAIPEPRSSAHFMDFQYHRMNLAEFTQLRRLSTRHTEVLSRLRHLADRSARLKEEGAGRAPTMSYAFAPVVGWGARSASVAGLVLSAAPLLGWDHSTIHASVDALWMYVAQQVPEFVDPATQVMNPLLSTTMEASAHTGGVVALHTGGVAILTSHTGGIGAQLAALASHTGGFA